MALGAFVSRLEMMSRSPSRVRPPALRSTKIDHTMPRQPVGTSHCSKREAVNAAARLAALHFKPEVAGAEIVAFLRIATPRGNGRYDITCHGDQDKFADDAGHTLPRGDREPLKNASQLRNSPGND